MKKMESYNNEPVRFGVIGSGWRSEFYIRIATALPKIFELTGVLVRNEDKKRYLEEKYNAPVFLDPVSFYKTQPDFVVVSISKPDIGALLITLMEKGIPVLSETPPAVEEGMLNVLWEKKVRYNSQILVAEQYYLYPSIQAKLKAIELGLVKNPYCIMTSYAHDYHGMSLIRKFLGTGFQNAIFYGDTFEYPIVETIGREGFITQGKTSLRPWFRSTIQFENGKTAFYDFSPVLYQSFLRSRHLTVMGANGQIMDNEVSYLNEEGVLVNEAFNELKDPYDGDCIRVQLGSKVLYENPFPKTRMTEDEIAIAQSMLYMKEYLDTGIANYPFEEALQDTYLAIKMKEAAGKHGEKVYLEKQIWCE